MLRTASLASLLLLVSCKSTKSKPPTIEDAPKVLTASLSPAAESGIDLYGDALPVGAIGRLGSLRMMDRSLRQMVFSADGSQIFSTHRRGYQIWNLSDGSRGALLHDANPGDKMAVSPNGKLLATANDSGSSLQLWNLDSGKKQSHVSMTANPIGLCFLANSKLLVGFPEGTITIWDVGGQSESFEGPWREATTMACAPTSGWITIGTATGDAFAVQVDPKNFSVTKSVKLGSASKGFETTAIASDASVFAFGSEDESIYLWYRPETAVPFSVLAHKRSVKSLAFTPDNKLLISSGGDSWIRKWNPRNGKLLREMPGPPSLDSQYIALSPDGNLIAAWSELGGARGSESGRWWLRSAANGASLLEPKRHRGAITAVAYSPGGRRIATASDDKTIRLWETTSTKNISTQTSSHGAIDDVQFSADGKRLYSAGADAQVRIWNQKTGKTSIRIKGIGAEVSRLLVAEDRGRIYTADRVGRVWEWNQNSGRKIRSLDHKNFTAVYDIARSSDGKYLAIAGAANFVSVVDLKSGQEVAQLESENTTAQYAVVFSADSRLLAVAGDGKHITLWNCADWSQSKTLVGHDGVVRTLAFTPDGTLLVSGGDDELVLVWNVQSGQALATLAGHQDAVTRVTISPNGSEILSASRDHTALLWRTPSVLSP